MRELEKKQKFRRRAYSFPALAGLLVLTVILGRGAVSLIAKERESAKDAAALAGKVAALQAHEEELKREIGKLHTEEGLEEEIKSKYNVAKPGEHVAVIVDRPEANSTTTPEKISWWKALLNYFGE